MRLRIAYNRLVDYAGSVEYLMSFADFETTGRFEDRPDLEPVRRLVEAMGIEGDPDWWFVTVHVGGTKGKGSTAAMIESILCEAGDRAGLYTSPHLHSFAERVRICRTSITEQRFAEVVERYVKPAAEQVSPSLSGRALVTFDLLTALGLAHCATSNVDYLVMEVGLGGRLDSTNIFKQTDVVVLTPISLEHTAVLGGTIAQIAREKAGIIKPHASIVMAPQSYPEAASIFKETAAANDPPLKGPAFVDVQRDYSWEVLGHDLRGQQIRIQGPWGSLDAQLPLLGRHQLENAATAVAAVKALDERISSTIDANPGTIARGLEKTHWPGRFEVVHEAPLVVVDGAHNRDSARRFVETMREYLDCERALFIVGSSADKDIDALAEEIAPAAERTIAARSSHPRSMEPALVAAAFQRRGVESEYVDSVGSALDRALAATESGGVICLVGSLFVAAEGREYFGLSYGPAN